MLLSSCVQVSCLQQSEPGVVMFKLDFGLQFRVSINPATMQSLRLKAAALQNTGTYTDDSSRLVSLSVSLFVSRIIQHG